MQLHPLRLIIVLSVLHFSDPIAAQEYSIRGRILDGDTRMPIDSAVIYCFTKGYNDYLVQTTDASGYFEFGHLQKGRYTLDISHDGYKNTIRVQRIKDSSITETILLYSSSSANQTYIEDIADEDRYHGAFAVLFAPWKDKNEKKTIRGELSFEWTYSFKHKLARFDQVGIDLTPIKFYWCNLKNDTVITRQVYEKEKYFGYYVSAFVYNRLIFFKQKKSGFPGLFLDIGAGYELPLIFEYKYASGEGKKVHDGIHNYKEFSGLMRLGFDVFSIKATYRFCDIIKNNYPQPPKISIGIEFHFPERYI